MWAPSFIKQEQSATIIKASFAECIGTGSDNFDGSSEHRTPQLNSAISSVESE